jgi:hypothetical protein
VRIRAPTTKVVGRGVSPAGLVVGDQQHHKQKKIRVQSVRIRVPYTQAEKIRLNLPNPQKSAFPSPAGGK